MDIGAQNISSGYANMGWNTNPNANPEGVAAIIAMTASWVTALFVPVLANIWGPMATYWAVKSNGWG